MDAYERLFESACAEADAIARIDEEILYRAYKNIGKPKEKKT